MSVILNDLAALNEDIIIQKFDILLAGDDSDIVGDVPSLKMKLEEAFGELKLKFTFSGMSF